MKQVILYLIVLITTSCALMKTTVNKENITFDYPNQKSKKGKELTFETTLNCSAEEVWKLYQKPSVWLENLNPQAKLSPTRDNKKIENWELNKNYTFVLYMYGFIPFGKHHVSFEKIDFDNLIIQSREHGFMVPHWDNYFEIVSLTDSTCKIKDVLKIQSTGINAIVSFYAKGVFKAKHKKIAREIE